MAETGTSFTSGPTAVTKEFVEHESRTNDNSIIVSAAPDGMMASDISSSGGGDGPGVSDSIDASTFLNISRILQGTVASQSKFANQTTTEEEKTPPEAPTQPPPPIIQSRILQDTEASAERFVKSPINSKKGAHRFEELKEIVHTHTEDIRRKETEAEERLRLINEEKKKKQEETSKKLQSSLDKAKERKALADKMEEQRLALVKERLEEKSNRRPSTDQKQARTLDLRPTTPKQEKKPSITVPVEPHFATDDRLGPKPSPLTLKKDVPSMAEGEDILRRSLRTDFDSCTPKQDKSTSLTVPQGPKFSGSPHHHAHEIKESPSHPGVAESSSFDSSSPIYKAQNVERNWYSTLRVSAASESADSQDKQEAPRVTTPVAPKFHPIHHRERPKSTEEMEEEMMEHYRQHPFKATPIKMNDHPSGPTSSASPARAITIPEPFHFRTDARIKTPDRPKYTPSSSDSSRKEAKQFRARPMPDFSKSHGLFAIHKERELTRPQPFRFHTTSRSPAPSSSANTATPRSGKTNNRVRSRPNPDFDRLARPRQVALTPEQKPVPFKARPMPNFASSSVPHTINYRFTHKAPEPSPERPEVRNFKARPVPDYSKDYVPVQYRDPTKLKVFAVPKELRQKIMSPSSSKSPHGLRPNRRASPAFKAKPLPNFSKQSIPVRDRDPSKHRTLTPEQRHEIMKPVSIRRFSPEYKTQHSPNSGSTPKPSPAKAAWSFVEDNDSMSRSVFRARPLPDFSRQMMPVRDRDPAKLKTPHKMKTIHERSQKDKGNERDTWFTAKPGADPFLTFL